jgi:ectoine hydroxylase-related dioxygenase (phytanoyl-CoA dioxygenase family)
VSEWRLLVIVAAMTVSSELARFDCRAEGWLERVETAVEYAGCAVVENVIPADLLSELSAALYSAREAILDEIGRDRLERAGELGVLRLPMKFAPSLLELIELPEVLAVVDATISETAILHLQNGLLLPPSAESSEGEDAGRFQRSFHRDFPRILNGYLASINTLFAIDAFTAENGGTIVVPGTHQTEAVPSEEQLERVAVPVECPAGSMLVFDSTLLHAAGTNRSGKDRLGVNQQFTRSYIKQQIDYCRALGPDVVTAQKARTQQLLGWYTRVVTSLDEYYRPAEERLYRSGQG